MREIIINDHHTWQDWGLIMTAKTVEPPSPKTNYISVPGRDGDLDLTEAASGMVNYAQRNATFGFLTDSGTVEDRMQLFALITNLIHGRTVKIQDNDDYLGCYMTGRAAISNIEHLQSHSTFTLECSLDPWRYMEINRVYILPATQEAQEYAIHNSGSRYAPATLENDAAATVTYNGETYQLAAGTHTDTGILIVPGASKITVSGSTVTLKYKEAIL